MLLLLLLAAYTFYCAIYAEFVKTTDSPQSCPPLQYFHDCDPSNNSSPYPCERSCLFPDLLGCSECGLCLCEPGMFRNTTTGQCVPASRCRTNGLTECRKQVLKMHRYGLPTVPAYVPSCDREGYFHALQCNRHDVCWCVHKRTGVVVHGTHRSQGHVAGGEYCEEGPCQYLKDLYPTFCHTLMEQHNASEICNTQYSVPCRWSCCVYDNQLIDL